MTKKILYIDPLSLYGHVNFNKIHIRELLSLDFNIDFIFKSGYSSSLGTKENILTLPSYLYSKNNSIFSRLNDIKILRYITKRINFNEYDYVILSSYDEISLFFSGISTELILINHNNLQSLENSIKRFFFKRISNTNIHIVLENYMIDYLLNFKIKNVFKIGHGLPDPIKLSETKSIITIGNCLINLDDFKKIIFIPSLSQIDEEFILGLLSDLDFINFLNNNNVLLLLKTNLNIKTKLNNFYLISEVLSDIDFNSIFFKSNLVIIKYPIYFKNRVSAIFFQCVSNNKTCLINKIEPLYIYNDNINYDCFYETKEELISKIKILLSMDMKFKYIKINELKSDYNLFFKNQKQ
jgi:hypothetical protein